MLDKTILLVDYEPKGLASVKSYLEGLGFTVETATDGSIALTKFFEKRPDMVVLSPMLPKIHGFDVCRQITQSPEGKDVPVIIVTAVYKGSKYRNEAIHSCGARAYFEKPYSEDELTDTIFKLLNIKREKPVAVKPAGGPREKSIEDMLPDLKADRTIPFIKKSDVLATLQLGKQKLAARPPESPKAPEPKPADEKFVTSEDIFGDVIESFETPKMSAPAPAVPAPKEEVVTPPPAPRPEPIAAPPPPPPKPAAPPRPTVDVKPEPKVPPVVPVPEPTIRIPTAPKPDIGATVRVEATDELAKLDQTMKKAAAPPPPPKVAPRDDMERKLEETLSGLSLGAAAKPRPARPAPAPPKVELPKIELPRPAPVVAAPPPAPPVMEAPKVEPAKIEPPVPPPPPPPIVEAPKIAVHKVEIPRPAPPPPPPPLVEPPKAEVPRPAPPHVAEPPRIDVRPFVAAAPTVEAPPKIEPPRPQPVVAAPPPPPPPVVEPPKVAEAPRPEPKAEPPKREDRPRAVPGKFGDYVLLERIATGGMAELYRAKRSGPEGFEKILAIKRILPHLSDNEEFVTMFIDEAKVAAQLNHPNICHIYDLGRLEDSYFIAMEFVLGRDLRAIIKEADKRGKGVPYELAAYVGIKVCGALEYAHRKLDYSQNPLNIVHRDVSPQNVLLSYEGEVKLVDFGVAKAASKAHHTTHGALKGKILYMSPEQAWGKTIDHRSDIFSLGSVLFEMTTGKKLFLGDSEISTLEAVRNGKVVAPSSIKKDLPKQLEEIILKALKPKADDRYQSAGEMQKALDGFFEHAGLRPGPQDLSEFMWELFADEMKAVGIQIEPRKVTARPVPPRAPELTIKVDKPPVKVPPPKVITPVEKPAAPPAPAPPPHVEAPAKEPVAARHAEPDVSFKPILDTGVHTGYQRVKKRRMGIIAAIVAVLVVIGAVMLYVGSRQPAPTPMTPTPTPQPPPVAAPTPQPPAQELPVEPTKLTPEEEAAQKAKLDEERKKREEDRQKAQLAEQDRKKQEEEAARVADEAAKAAETERLRLEEEASKKAADEEAVRKAAADAEKTRQDEAARQAAAKAAVKEGDIIPINQVDTKPVPVSRPMPVYPEMAKRSNVQGTVKLSILISETGTVLEMRIQSPTGGKMDILNEAARSAVTRWKYQPATKNGKRVKVWTNVDIPFVPR